MEIERRVVARPVELRERNGESRIEGYAAIFNVLSDDLGGFREMILPGAFAEVLDNDVRALWQHDPKYVFGRQVNGTLDLAEDEIGLRYAVTVPDAQWARDAVASIRRGDVDQSSFGFTMLDGERWAMAEDGQVIRTIFRVARLYDVSPVTFPAYTQTSVEARNQASALQVQRAGPDEARSDTARVRRAARQRRLDLAEKLT